MLAWLSVWDEVQICIWPSWCHCHSLSLAPVNPDWFYFASQWQLPITRSPVDWLTIVWSLNCDHLQDVKDCIMCTWPAALFRQNKLMSDQGRTLIAVCTWKDVKCTWLTRRSLADLHVHAAFSYLTALWSCMNIRHSTFYSTQRLAFPFVPECCANVGHCGGGMLMLHSCSLISNAFLTYRLCFTFDIYIHVTIVPSSPKHHLVSGALQEGRHQMTPRYCMSFVCLSCLVLLAVFILIWSNPSIWLKWLNYCKTVMTWA